MKREDAPGRDEFPLFRSITTRWMDQDSYGHVNNVQYYSYFDTAVNQHLIEEAGLNPRSTDVVGMVVDTQCSFFHELTFPETVEAGIRVSKLGRSSITYQIGIFRQGEDKPAALGHFVHVYVERATMTPTPIPAHVRAAVEPLVVE
ncbi:acyl-CoA thioesterase [Hwanghaeella sp.]|uniref:acyl-CoA thioesterase n=1 Tax=Hwanghaeella sp. TaxID=2605943 RepID=UPI003CCBACE8